MALSFHRGWLLQLAAAAAVLAAWKLNCAAAQTTPGCGCLAAATGLRDPTLLPTTLPEPASQLVDVPAVRIDDMLLPVSDLLPAAAGSSAYINCRRPWPAGVLHYQFSQQYPLRPRELVRQALAELSQKADFYVNFTEVDPAWRGPHVQVIDSTGCWSYVGRVTSAGPQYLSLEVPGCMLESIVQHEFMHALGFDHEHSRLDRDSHLQILWANILTGACSQFDKDNHLIPADFPPYDVNSVMHYTSDAFACQSGMVTMKVKPTGGLIAERTNLTQTDVSKLRYVYAKSNLDYCASTRVTAAGGLVACWLLLTACWNAWLSAMS